MKTIVSQTTTNPTLSIGYVSLLDFTLKIPGMTHGETKEIKLKKNQKFELMNCGWMNWIQIKKEEDPSKIGLASWDTFVIMSNEYELHISHLDSEKRCVRESEYDLYIRDKKLSQIINN